MARPVNADAAATRERMLRAATRLFSQRGLKDTSVRAVADDAGVSLALVHHYFGSKDGLYRACLESTYGALGEDIIAFGRLFERMSADMARAAPAQYERAVEDTVRAAFRFARERRGTLQLIMRSLVERGELDVEWDEAWHLPYLDQTSTHLSALLDRPRQEMRLLVQSITSLGMRYALASERELALMAGVVGPECDAVSPAQAAEAVRRVEDHLVAVARTLLRPLTESRAA